MNREKTRLKDDGWRIPDELWERIKILLPPPSFHPLGCHNPPADPRKTMDAIFFILRTGAQWKSLSVHGFMSGSTAHGWFQRWLKAGVFHELWKMMLEEDDDSIGIDWSWLSMDGSMVKSPLGGDDAGPNPTDRGKKRDRAKRPHRRQRDSGGLSIAGANTHDMKLVESTLENMIAFRPIPTPEQEQNLCMDKGATVQ